MASSGSGTLAHPDAVVALQRYWTNLLRAVSVVGQEMGTEWDASRKGASQVWYEGRIVDAAVGSFGEPLVLLKYYDTTEEWVRLDEDAQPNISVKYILSTRVVWCQVKGYPWWPAQQLVSSQSLGTEDAKRQRDGSGFVQCRFFDDDTSQWAHVCDVHGVADWTPSDALTSRHLGLLSPQQQPGTPSARTAAGGSGFRAGPPAVVSSSSAAPPPGAVGSSGATAATAAAPRKPDETLTAAVGSAIAELESSTSAGSAWVALANARLLSLFPADLAERAEGGGAAPLSAPVHATGVGAASGGGSGSAGLPAGAGFSHADGIAFADVRLPVPRGALLPCGSKYAVVAAGTSGATPLLTGAQRSGGAAGSVAPVAGPSHPLLESPATASATAAPAAAAAGGGAPRLSALLAAPSPLSSLDQSPAVPLPPSAFVGRWVGWWSYAYTPPDSEVAEPETGAPCPSFASGVGFSSSSSKSQKKQAKAVSGEMGSGATGRKSGAHPEPARSGSGSGGGGAAVSSSHRRRFAEYSCRLLAAAEAAAEQQWEARGAAPGSAANVAAAAAGPAGRLGPAAAVAAGFMAPGLDALLPASVWTLGRRASRRPLPQPPAGHSAPAGGGHSGPLSVVQVLAAVMGGGAAARSSAAATGALFSDPGSVSVSSAATEQGPTQAPPATELQPVPSRSDGPAGGVSVATGGACDEELPVPDVPIASPPRTAASRPLASASPLRAPQLAPADPMDEQGELEEGDQPAGNASAGCAAVAAEADSTALSSSAHDSPAIHSASQAALSVGHAAAAADAATAAVLGSPATATVAASALDAVAVSTDNSLGADSSGSGAAAKQPAPFSDGAAAAAVPAPQPKPKPKRRNKELDFLLDSTLVPTVLALAPDGMSGSAVRRATLGGRGADAGAPKAGSAASSGAAPVTAAAAASASPGAGKRAQQQPALPSSNRSTATGAAPPSSSKRARSSTGAAAAAAPFPSSPSTEAADPVHGVASSAVGRGAVAGNSASGKSGSGTGAVARPRSHHAPKKSKLDEETSNPTATACTAGDAPASRKAATSSSSNGNITSRPSVSTAASSSSSSSLRRKELAGLSAPSASSPAAGTRFGLPLAAAAAAAEAPSAHGRWVLGWVARYHTESGLHLVVYDTPRALALPPQSAAAVDRILAGAAVGRPAGLPLGTVGAAPRGGSGGGGGKVPRASNPLAALPSPLASSPPAASTSAVLLSKQWVRLQDQHALLLPIRAPLRLLAEAAEAHAGDTPAAASSSDPYSPSASSSDPYSPSASSSDPSPPASFEAGSEAPAPSSHSRPPSAPRPLCSVCSHTATPLDPLLVCAGPCGSAVHLSCIDPLRAAQVTSLLSDRRALAAAALEEGEGAAVGWSPLHGGGSEPTQSGGAAAVPQTAPQRGTPAYPLQPHAQSTPASPLVALFRQLVPRSVAHDILIASGSGAMGGADAAALSSSLASSSTSVRHLGGFVFSSEWLCEACRECESCHCHSVSGPRRRVRPAAPPLAARAGSGAGKKARGGSGKPANKKPKSSASALAVSAATAAVAAAASVVDPAVAAVYTEGSAISGVGGSFEPDALSIPTYVASTPALAAAAADAISADAASARLSLEAPGAAVSSQSAADVLPPAGPAGDAEPSPVAEEPAPAVDEVMAFGDAAATVPFAAGGRPQTAATAVTSAAAAGDEHSSSAPELCSSNATPSALNTSSASPPADGSDFSLAHVLADGVDVARELDEGGAQPASASLPPRQPLPAWLMGLAARGADSPDASDPSAGELYISAYEKRANKAGKAGASAAASTGAKRKRPSRFADGEDEADPSPSAAAAAPAVAGSGVGPAAVAAEPQEPPAHRWGLHSYTPVPGTRIYNERRHVAMWGPGEEGLGSLQGEGAPPSQAPVASSSTAASSSSQLVSQQPQQLGLLPHASSSPVPSASAPLSAALLHRPPSESVPMLLCAYCTVRVGQGALCPVCHGIYHEDDTDMLLCDDCGGWIHAACDGLSTVDLLAIEDETHAWWSHRYTCPLCRHRHMVGLLDELRAEDRAGHFALPVTAEAAPGYHNVIRQPMDLWSMAKALDAGLFDTCGGEGIQRFRVSFELIVKNALVFNTPQDRVYKDAWRFLRAGALLFQRSLPQTHDGEHRADFERLRSFLKDPRLLSETALLPSTAPPAAASLPSTAGAAAASTAVTAAPSASGELMRGDGGSATAPPTAAVALLGRRSLSSSAAGAAAAAAATAATATVSGGGTGPAPSADSAAHLSSFSSCSCAGDAGGSGEQHGAGDVPGSATATAAAVTAAAGALQPDLSPSSSVSSHPQSGGWAEVQPGTGAPPAPSPPASAPSAASAAGGDSLADRFAVLNAGTAGLGSGAGGGARGAGASSAPVSLPEEYKARKGEPPIIQSGLPLMPVLLDSHSAPLCSLVDVCGTCGGTMADGGVHAVACVDCGEAFHLYCIAGPLFSRMTAEAAAAAVAAGTDGLGGMHQHAPSAAEGLAAGAGPSAPPGLLFFPASASPAAGPLVTAPALGGQVAGLLLSEPAAAALSSAALADAIEQLRRGWRCPNCKVCEVCGECRLEHEGQLLVCDGCDSGFHTFCAVPQLPVVPDGDWFCSRCVHCKRCGAQGAGIGAPDSGARAALPAGAASSAAGGAHPARTTLPLGGWSLTRDSCSPCSMAVVVNRSRGENSCPGCAEEWGMEEHDLAECDGCGRWTHFRCDPPLLGPASLPWSEAPGFQYFCPQCRCGESGVKGTAQAATAALTHHIAAVQSSAGSLRVALAVGFTLREAATVAAAAAVCEAAAPPPPAVSGGSSAQGTACPLFPGAPTASPPLQSGAPSASSRLLMPPGVGAALASAPNPLVTAAAHWRAGVASADVALLRTAQASGALCPRVVMHAADPPPGSPPGTPRLRLAPLLPTAAFDAEARKAGVDASFHLPLPPKEQDALRRALWSGTCPPALASRIHSPLLSAQAASQARAHRFVRSRLYSSVLRRERFLRAGPAAYHLQVAAAAAAPSPLLQLAWLVGAEGARAAMDRLGGGAGLADTPAAAISPSTSSLGRVAGYMAAADAWAGIAAGPAPSLAAGGVGAGEGALSHHVHSGGVGDLGRVPGATLSGGADSAAPVGSSGLATAAGAHAGGASAVGAASCADEGEYLLPRARVPRDSQSSPARISASLSDSAVPSYQLLPPLVSAVYLGPDPNGIPLLLTGSQGLAGPEAAPNLGPAGGPPQATDYTSLDASSPTPGESAGFAVPASPTAAATAAPTATAAAAQPLGSRRSLSGTAPSPPQTCVPPAAVADAATASAGLPAPLLAEQAPGPPGDAAALQRGAPAAASIAAYRSRALVPVLLEAGLAAPLTTPKSTAHAEPLDGGDDSAVIATATFADGASAPVVASSARHLALQSSSHEHAPILTQQQQISPVASVVALPLPDTRSCVFCGQVGDRGAGLAGLLAPLSRAVSAMVLLGPEAQGGAGQGRGAAFSPGRQYRGGGGAQSPTAAPLPGPLARSGSSGVLQAVEAGPPTFAALLRLLPRGMGRGFSASAPSSSSSAAAAVSSLSPEASEPLSRDGAVRAIVGYLRAHHQLLLRGVGVEGRLLPIPLSPDAASLDPPRAGPSALGAGEGAAGQSGSLGADDVSGDASSVSTDPRGAGLSCSSGSSSSSRRDPLDHSGEAEAGGGGHPRGGTGTLGASQRTPHAHSLCAAWASEVVLDDEEGTLGRVHHAARRAAHTRCSYCGHAGAALACSGAARRDCWHVFHLRCALAAGALLTLNPVLPGGGGGSVPSGGPASYRPKSGGAAAAGRGATGGSYVRTVTCPGHRVDGYRSGGPGGRWDGSSAPSSPFPSLLELACLLLPRLRDPTLAPLALLSHATMLRVLPEPPHCAPSAQIPSGPDAMACVHAALSRFFASEDYAASAAAVGPSLPGEAEAAPPGLLIGPLGTEPPPVVSSSSSRGRTGQAAHPLAGQGSARGPFPTEPELGPALLEHRGGGAGAGGSTLAAALRMAALVRTHPGAVGDDVGNALFFSRRPGPPADDSPAPEGPAFPCLRIGALTVLRWGRIVTRRGGYNKPHALVPVGFRSRRIWWGPGPVDPATPPPLVRVSYTCDILDGFDPLEDEGAALASATATVGEGAGAGSGTGSAPAPGSPLLPRADSSVRDSTPGSACTAPVSGSPYPSPHDSGVVGAGAAGSSGGGRALPPVPSQSAGAVLARGGSGSSGGSGGSGPRVTRLPRRTGPRFLITCDSDPTLAVCARSAEGALLALRLEIVRRLGAKTAGHLLSWEEAALLLLPLAEGVGVSAPGVEGPLLGLGTGAGASGQQQQPNQRIPHPQHHKLPRVLPSGALYADGASSAPATCQPRLRWSTALGPGNAVVVLQRGAASAQGGPPPAPLPPSPFPGLLTGDAYGLQGGVWFGHALPAVQRALEACPDAYLAMVTPRGTADTWQRYVFRYTPPVPAAVAQARATRDAAAAAAAVATAQERAGGEGGGGAGGGGALRAPAGSPIPQVPALSAHGCARLIPYDRNARNETVHGSSLLAARVSSLEGGDLDMRGGDLDAVDRVSMGDMLATVAASLAAGGLAAASAHISGSGAAAAAAAATLSGGGAAAASLAAQLNSGGGGGGTALDPLSIPALSDEAAAAAADLAALAAAAASSPDGVGGVGGGLLDPSEPGLEIGGAAPESSSSSSAAASTSGGKAGAASSAGGLPDADDAAAEAAGPAFSSSAAAAAALLSPEYEADVPQDDDSGAGASGSGEGQVTESSLARMYRALRASVQSQRLVTRRSPIHGWGLFLKTDAPKDSVLIEYTGQLVRQPVADRREVLYEERARLRAGAWTAESLLAWCTPEAAPAGPCISATAQQGGVHGDPSLFSSAGGGSAGASSSSAPPPSVNNPDGSGVDALTLFQPPVGVRHSDGSGSCYLFRLDDDFIVDATDRGSSARFINHCCEPNCYSRVIAVDGEKHIVIMALRNLRRGEELTYNYKFALETDPSLKLPCYCGALSCWKSMN